MKPRISAFAGAISLVAAIPCFAQTTKARHYPMSLPVLMSSKAERDQLLKIEPVSKVRPIAARADLRLIGVGQMDKNFGRRAAGSA